MFFYLNISERSIERYGVAAVTRWAFLRSRCRNGVIYGEWNERKARKLGWSRGKYYNVLKELTAAGLIEKRGDHYILATAAEVRGRSRHLCKIKLPAVVKEAFVRDMLRLKLMEMTHRQVAGAIVPRAGRRGAKQERIRLLEEQERRRYGHHSAETLTVHLGSTHDDLVRSAANGYVPMNTEKLMRSTGLGRTALFEWKKRCKARGWFDQYNRTWKVPPELSTAARDDRREVEVMYRGKVSATAYGYKFHQAAVYSLKVNYKSTHSK